MKNSLELVIPVRDKDLKLFANCLRTVKRAERDYVTVSVIDIGSENKDVYRRFAKAMDFCYKYIDYGIWNKPLALNYALKRTDADWFGMLDGDYLIEDTFFDVVDEEMESNTFLQCRGYDMPDIDFAINKLRTSLDMANAIANHNMNSRPEADYGGFQAFPTEVGKELNGYDERFKLYGGMHYEMKERLLNYTLNMKRLHGDPILLHQNHEQWPSANKNFSEQEIEQEREEHIQIIKKLESNSRIYANQGQTWGKP